MTTMNRPQQIQQQNSGRNGLSTSGVHVRPEGFGLPEILPHEITKTGVLGDGSFGTVYKGVCRQKDVAIKVLHNQDIDAKTLEAFKKEVDIVSKIFHPNIVLFMGACTERGHLMIVTELMQGDLETMLADEKVNLGLYTRMKMVKGAALGMTWLHSSHPMFIHRDLKTSNLLLDQNYSIKICDFGLSQVKSMGENLLDGKEGAKGTPLWMAPEVLAGHQFNEKADVYSFGIVLWEVLTRMEPFQEFENFEEFRRAVCIQHVRPNIPQETDPSIRSLIEQCWHPDPNQRPTFPDIVKALDHIIIDCAARDPHGRIMWKQRFLEQEEVKWNVFVETLLALLHQTNTLSRGQRLPAEKTTLHDLALATDDQLREFSQRGSEQYYLVQQEYQRRVKSGHFAVPASALAEPGFMDQLNLNALKAVLAEQPKSSDSGVMIRNSEMEVSLERFGRILDWFGPIVDPNRTFSFLDKITGLLREPWFHGDVGTHEAESRLASQPVGTFLVRFSSTSPGCYTISKVAPNSINHQRILHSMGHSFYVNSKRFDSLQQLVQQSALDLGLTNPCNGSPFKQIFVEHNVTGYLQQEM
eukprot:TRINITY_DN4345_c0_g1_i1.p1 TRINITY_DN4345_c0_g1~~TRINITY_DN4345_c0_g1_i1.p1  ORF type:complete len:583 (+),score=95.87 TRINITY_DN4345_c0_g1_i1:118-1866(+)